MTDQSEKLNGHFYLHTIDPSITITKKSRSV